MPFCVILQHQPTMRGKWSSDGPKASLTSPVRAEGPSCETEGIPEHDYKIMVKINFSKKGKWNRSTELCVDLKTILRSDPVMKTGKTYQGILRRDSDAEIEEFRCHDPHFTFVETMPWLSKRNPRVYMGEHISVTRRDDGSLRLNFRPLKTDGHFSVERYALAVYNELCLALGGLIEEA